MIKVISIEGRTSTDRLAVLFADTKTEVPATAEDMTAEGLPLAAGTILYTAKLETAVLKSDGTWEWGD